MKLDYMNMKRNRDKTEKRNLFIRSIKLETRETDTGKIITGVIPYNSKSVDIYGWNYFEKIAPTAWNKTLSDKANVYCLVAHNVEKIMGSVKSGTLALSSESDGLHFSVSVPDTSYGKDAYFIIKNKICTSMSFAFEPIKTHIDDDGTHVIDEAKLFEVSVCVAFPAYEQTKAQANESTEERMDDTQLKAITSAIADGAKAISDNLVKALEPAKPKEPDNENEEPSNDTDSDSDTTQRNADSKAKELRKTKAMEAINGIFIDSNPTGKEGK